MMTREDYAGLPPIPADFRLSYGTDPEQFGDLYLPEKTGAHAVVLLLHGGCWLAKWGLDQLGGLCKAFTDEGLAVWNMEYRRLGNGGGWPGTFQDVAAGMDFLGHIGAEYSLDTSRIVAVGHSAGGQLALWLAGRHTLPARSDVYSAFPLPLRGVVSLAGIPDLALAVERNICGDAPQKMLGGVPVEVPSRYRHGSPIELLPLGIPQRHINGVFDEVVPADYVQQCIRVAAQHDDVRLDLVSDAGHFDLAVPREPAWPIVKKAVLELVG
jgi:pimeloyl-ACP methyl ester carboxylesterase